MEWIIRNPNFRETVRLSFEKQNMMHALGAVLKEIEPGRTVISMPFSEQFCQQNGYLHAGAVTTIADSACGYAALSLMRPGQQVLSVEFKINLMAPAKGRFFQAEGVVMRPGKTLTITRAIVTAHEDEHASGIEIASFQGTMIGVTGK